jgi:hypothetical protein
MGFNLSQFFREDNSSRPTMFVPYIRDTDNWSKQVEVQTQCKKCAEKLASHLFVWHKTFPYRSTVKFWCPREHKFLGMDLESFCRFIELTFSVRTADNREWRLDKKVASLIFEQCIAADSPLPEASWQVEAERKKAGK